jgi:exodeoxyribonuclease VII large subunit
LPARISQLRQRVVSLQSLLERYSPAARLRHERERVLAMQASLNTCLQHAAVLRRERVQSLASQLALMNPYATLERGYSITYDAGGHVVASVVGVQEGQQFAIQMADGMIGAKATAARSGPLMPPRDRLEPALGATKEPALSPARGEGSLA